VEHEFAKEMDADEKVKFYCKLPRWFTVSTPLGKYNPDWAVVLERNNKVYLVSETKGSLNPDSLRNIEKLKIECGKSHFKELEVEFKQATKFDDIRRAYPD
jgi:type III restriction enzyme